METDLATGRSGRLRSFETSLGNCEHVLELSEFVKGSFRRGSSVTIRRSIGIPLDDLQRHLDR